MKLLFGIKVSKTFRVNLLYKVGYHMVSKCLSVNVSYLELSKGVMVRKGLRVNMLNLELLDGVSVSNSLRLTSLTKWVTIGLRF